MNTEVIALLNLLDDPDTIVYEAVNSKIKSYGSAIIPILEQHTEIQNENIVQQRVTSLITQLQWQNILQDFELWKKNEAPSLLDAAILLSKISFTDVDNETVYKTFEKISKDTWIELNNYLTPLEKTTIISNIIYKFHKYNGVEINYEKSNEFLLQHLLATKKGNSFSLAILYVTLCQVLDVPVCILQFPKQLILGYLDIYQDYFIEEENNFEKIKFFIDPVFGNAINHNDISIFLKRLNIAPSNKYFTPLTPVETIVYVLKEYTKCFTATEHKEKHNFLLQLIETLS
jgi:hypothetical protein